MPLLLVHEGQPPLLAGLSQQGTGDFRAALEGALGQIAPQPYRHPTATRTGPRGPDLGHLRQLIQQTRFAAYRVEASCSPLTFLALGISLGLGRPYLMLYEQGTQVARDLRGIGIPSFATFTSLAREFAAQHGPYLQAVLGKG